MFYTSLNITAKLQMKLDDSKELSIESLIFYFRLIAINFRK